MHDYLHELRVPDRILLGPGPSNVHPRVLQAMLTPMLGHLAPDRYSAVDDVRSLRRRFRERARRDSFSCAGYYACRCTGVGAQQIVQG